MVSDDSGCLDEVAKLSPQDWGRADKLTQITRRALKAWLNEDRRGRGLDYTANVSVNPQNPKPCDCCLFCRLGLDLNLIRAESYTYGKYWMPGLAVCVECSALLFGVLHRHSSKCIALV